MSDRLQESLGDMIKNGYALVKGANATVLATKTVFDNQDSYKYKKCVANKKYAIDCVTTIDLYEKFENSYVKALANQTDLMNTYGYQVTNMYGNVDFSFTLYVIRKAGLSTTPSSTIDPSRLTMTFDLFLDGKAYYPHDITLKLESQAKLEEYLLQYGFDFLKIKYSY